jgi:hypothetical protein
MKTLEGKIADIDWVASDIVVKTFDGADEITFMVPRDTKITKGTDIIDLSDLNQEDQVTVQYYDDHLAGLKTVSIVVKI